MNLWRQIDLRSKFDLSEFTNGVLNYLYFFIIGINNYFLIKLKGNKEKRKKKDKSGHMIWKKNLNIR